jgi:hypothetical protein
MTSTEASAIRAIARALKEWADAGERELMRLALLEGREELLRLVHESEADQRDSKR